MKIKREGQLVGLTADKWSRPCEARAAPLVRWQVGKPLPCLLDGQGVQSARRRLRLRSDLSSELKRARSLARCVGVVVDGRGRLVVGCPMHSSWVRTLRLLGWA